MAKVVVALLTDKQEFQLMQADEARQAAARAGLEAEVLFADDNAVVQIHQLFRHVHAPEGERPAAIVVETVTGEGLERVARNAVAASIGWIVINRKVGYVEPLRREHPELAIATVSVDNNEIGRIQGRQLRRLLPEGGRVLYLQGPPDTASGRERLEGTQQTIAESGIELKVLTNDGWTEERGEQSANTWLRLKTSEGFRPVVVCAQNDSLAVGARRALREHGLQWSNLAFLGCDGLPNGGQRLVRTGELTATIVTPAPTGPAVGLVARALAGERVAAELLLVPCSYPSEDELRGLRSAR